MCGTCVAEYSVMSPSGPGTASSRRGSIAFGISARLDVSPRDDDIGVRRAAARSRRCRDARRSTAFVPEVGMDERARPRSSALATSTIASTGLVVDLDELSRVLRLRTRLGEDDRDAVALVAGRLGERIVRRVLHVLGHRPGARHRRLPVVLEVGGREDGDDAVRLPCLVGRDPGDARARVRAADDDHRRAFPAAPCCRRYVPRPVSSDRSSRRLTGEPTYGRPLLGRRSRTPSPPLRPPGRPRRCCGSRCTGRGFPRGPRGSRPRSSPSPCSISETAAITMPGVQ